MKLYLGSDHGGFDLKQMLVHYLGTKQGLDVIDVGDKILDPQDDFPQFAAKAVHGVLTSDDKDARAILLCRGGQGMAMAANRHRGIRAAVCWDDHSAEKSRIDNDSNVLCIPADALHVDEVKDIIHTWLNTQFSGAVRYVRRNQELDEL